MNRTGMSSTLMFWCGCRRTENAIRRAMTFRLPTYGQLLDGVEL
jgi:hypothetical protein